jgi:ATP-dependent Lon protease
MCISLGGFDVMNRKTYIGAMPDELFKVWKSRNVKSSFVLDEIDKLSNSNQGDPSFLC